MSDEFNVPDGDIILRSQGSPNRDFRVHKLILSLASPVFRDMFSIPQPKSDTEPKVDTEVVDVTDPPQALDLVLRLIYPFPPPSVCSLGLIVDGIVIADKYNIEGARARLRLGLSKFISEAPLRVYAIASRFEFDEEAEAASALTVGNYYLPGLTLPDDMQHMPAPVYHKLIVLHEKHRDEIEDIVDSVLFEPNCAECKVAKALAEPRMRTKLVRIICRWESITVALCVAELGVGCKASCMIKFVKDVVTKLGSKNGVIRSRPPVQPNSPPSRTNIFV